MVAQALDASTAPLLAGSLRKLRDLLDALSLNTAARAAMHASDLRGLADREGSLLTDLRDAASTIEIVLSDMLDAARIDARAFVVMPQRMDLLAAVTKAARVMRPAATAQGVTLVCDVGVADASSVPPWVLGDRFRIMQALSNFMSNAIKFVPHDGSGRVTVRLRTQSSLSPPRPMDGWATVCFVLHDGAVAAACRASEEVGGSATTQAPGQASGRTPGGHARAVSAPCELEVAAPRGRPLAASGINHIAGGRAAAAAATASTRSGACRTCPALSVGPLPARHARAAKCARSQRDTGFRFRGGFFGG
jgi:hypothetical protein